MREDKKAQDILFEEVVGEETSPLVIQDKEEKVKYLLDEIRNRVILGDAFKVLKRLKITPLIWSSLTHHTFCSCPMTRS